MSNRGEGEASIENRYDGVIGVKGFDYPYLKNVKQSFFELQGIQCLTEWADSPEAAILGSKLEEPEPPAIEPKADSYTPDDMESALLYAKERKVAKRYHRRNSSVRPS